MRWLFAFLLAATFGAAAPPGSASTPLPVIEHGKGERCVESNDYMRRNHMKLLMHQRDNTMHRGIRTKKYSLRGCIDCHASAKTGSVASASTDFCRSCHEYAAVHLDCWDCHSTKPEKVAANTVSPVPVPGEAK